MKLLKRKGFGQVLLVTAISLISISTTTIASYYQVKIYENQIYEKESAYSYLTAELNNIGNYCNPQNKIKINYEYEKEYNKNRTIFVNLTCEYITSDRGTAPYVQFTSTNCRYIDKTQGTKKCYTFSGQYDS